MDHTIDHTSNTPLQGIRVRVNPTHIRTPTLNADKSEGCNDSNSKRNIEKNI